MPDRPGMGLRKTDADRKAWSPSRIEGDSLCQMGSGTGMKASPRMRVQIFLEIVFHQGP